ncbi:MAG: DUF2628 domain-containing protein [Nitratireductor sp.]
MHGYDSAMATYTVHTPPGEQGEEKLRFLSDGVSVLALIVPAIWLLWHRLWFVFIAYLLVAASLAVYGVMASDPSATVLSAIPGLYLFLEGNQLRRRKLEQSGWTQEGVVEASSLDEAELRWFKGTGHAGTRPAAEPSRNAPAWGANPVAGDIRPEPLIGIFGDEPSR